MPQPVRRPVVTPLFRRIAWLALLGSVLVVPWAEAQEEHVSGVSKRQTAAE